MRRAFVLLGFLFCISCGEQIPDNILKPPQMQKVLYELMQSDEYLSEHRMDSGFDEKLSRSKYYNAVFRKHAITKAEFYKSYRYYQQNPSLHKTIFDSLSLQLSREINNIDSTDKKKPSTK